jgi:2-desacetyl-2-hydroxyethyl bacteriochlorophyllide A dehydrogenase
MKALSIVEPLRAEVVETDSPLPADSEVLIRVESSGICGTDVHIYLGEYEGSYPIIPGHEFAGVVEAVGAGVRQLRPGDRVCAEPNIPCDACPSCLSNRQNFCERWQAIGVTRPGAMAQYVAVPEKAAFPIGSLSYESAAFVEPLSCVLHGIGRAGVGFGDHVLVFGAGPIGILLMRAMKAAGAAEVSVVDLNEKRLEFARGCGAAMVSRSAEGLGKSFDLVVDATGNTKVMGETWRYARQGGRILLFGVPQKGASVAFDAFALFRNGLSVFSSFTSVRNTFQAIRLLEGGSIEVADLVSHRLPLADFVPAIEMIRKGGGDAMKIQILPNG